MRLIYKLLKIKKLFRKQTLDKLLPFREHGKIGAITMPRKNAYAITITSTVQKRLLDLLDVIKESTCTAHSGPNVFGAIVSMKMILTNKKLHKAIR